MLKIECPRLGKLSNTEKVIIYDFFWKNVWKAQSILENSWKRCKHGLHNNYIIVIILQI